MFDEDEDDSKPRRNPFSDDMGDFGPSDFNFTWVGQVSQKEVKDFMKQTRNLSRSDGDDEEDLGEAWGGTEYSISTGMYSVDFISVVACVGRSSTAALMFNPLTPNVKEKFSYLVPIPYLFD